MTKYHIKKDGLPGVCSASSGNCPLGSDSEHYTNKAEVLAAAEEKLREENDYLASAKKDMIYHVGENGSVESCKFRDGQCEIKAFGKLDNVHSANKSVIIGAATGMKSVLGVKSVAPLKEPTVSSPVKPTETTKDARSVLAGSNPWNDKKRKEGWTEGEIRDFENSCGHTVPHRFRPTRISYGC